MQPKKPDIGAGPEGLAPSPEFVAEMQAQKATEDTGPQAPSPAEEVPPIPHLEMPSDEQLQAAEAQKPPFHLGIIIVSVILIAVGLISLFLTSSAIATVSGIVNILIGIGLLLHKEVVRKFAIFLIGVALILSIVAVFGLMTVEQSVNSKASDAQQAILSSNASSASKQKATDMIAANQDSLHTTYGTVFATYGFIIVFDIFLIVYLTRPSIKEVFR